jgi:uncharacterized protein YcbK (DUF882 family)
MTKNFTVHEFASKDGKAVPASLMPNLEELVKNLQVLRDELGEPLTILSGYRSPEHNRRVGGKPNSLHLRAMAADLTCKSKTPRQLHGIIERLIAKKKMKQGGLGLYAGFVHYDVRGRKARW